MVSTINNECAVALYEARAEAFRRCTRLTAPGKDSPAACGNTRDTLPAWLAWNAALGPSDQAACIALETWRRERVLVDAYESGAFL
jgi:hypothetical protein